MLILSLYVLVALLASLATADFLENFSFDAPFTQVDSNGDRIVSNSWRTSGSTSVEKNFIRLTPDRQSKKGSIWSRRSLDVSSFNAVLKFRISGQGKTMFGDGLALWITQQSYYVEGNLHGFQDKYIGVGIIFDTFKNTETLHLHKDVTILINDGQKTYEMMAENPQGCDADFRYHAARADFNVNSMSAAKIIADDNSISVLIDAKGSGQYVQCATISNHGLPRDWLRRSHIGITASTGQLADNHDVLGLASYSDEKVMNKEESVKETALAYESKPGQSHEMRLTDLENAMNQVIKNNEYLDHHVEHEFSGIQDHIDNLQNKLKASAQALAENKGAGGSPTSLVVIEPIIKKELDSSISGRLSKLESDLKSLIDRKMRELDGKVEQAKRAKASSVPAPDVSSSNNNDNNDNSAVVPCPVCQSCSSWPAYIVFLFNVALVGGFWFKFYRKRGRLLD